MAHTTAHTTGLRIMDRITDRTTGPRTTVIATRATVGAVAGAARAAPALAVTQTRTVAHGETIANALEEASLTASFQLHAYKENKYV